MSEKVVQLRGRIPDTEKITINLGYVDLGRIDLLVQEGFFSNRTDFIRTAIRNQLNSQSAEVSRSIDRHTLEVGLFELGAADLEAAPTGDGNNTAAFVCRTTRGSTRYSEHAYGLAVDVNPFQNPYIRGETVLPELARSYTDRTVLRPGMLVEGSPAVTAFIRRGWEWGGAWRSVQDPMHFSARGG